MEKLSKYDQTTVGLWRRAHHDLAAPEGPAYLAWAAVHAVLTGLRRYTDAAALLAAYDASAGQDADFVLIASLLPTGPANPRYYEVREAAFYLRWRELGGAP
jgi:hypothetical protein